MTLPPAGAPIFSRPLRWILRYHRGIAIALQLALIALANWSAFLLRFDGSIPDWAAELFWSTLPWLVAIRALTFIPFRLFEGLWKYTSIYDLKALVAGIAVSSSVFLAFMETLGPARYPRSILFIDAALLLLMLGGVRMSRRLYATASTLEGAKRVLIVGAGDAGELIVRDMRAHPERGYVPVGFVDDDRGKLRRRIHGVSVLGSTADIATVVQRLHPDEILIAIPSADPAVVRRMVRALEPFKIHLKTLPTMKDIIDGRVETSQIRSVSVEDLLARAPIGLDIAPVRQLIRGRRVLVTGAGGSIGSELCRQIARLDPVSLVMLDRYENTLHAIVVELLDTKGSGGLHAVVGDVTDSVRMDEVLAKYLPQIVFHAAAHKHVPLMEASPCEAIKNNVRGTRLLAEAAERHGVDKFIMISTDKAVNPTSVMGASKRIAELLVQYQQQGSGTSFATVRFGNVLGSNGSVVPRFVEQIQKGGPVTVTDPEMRRFFMLIPEAVQLVLHAAAQAAGGGTYVLEMGEQVKLVDMARDMIRLSGLVPDEDIAIQFIGLRPGEKLYEELVGSREDVGPSAIEKVLKVTPRNPPDEAWRRQALALEEMALHGDESGTAAMLRTVLDDYAPAIIDGAGPAAPAIPAARATTDPQETDAMTDALSQACPSCHEAVHRSRARSLVERVRRNFTEKRLFRCEQCGWRGWLVPMDMMVPSASGEGSEVDLNDLDIELPGRSDTRDVFMPRDL